MALQLKKLKKISGKFLLYKEKVNRFIVDKHSFQIVHVIEFTFLYYYIIHVTIELGQLKMPYYQET